MSTKRSLQPINRRDLGLERDRVQLFSDKIDRQQRIVELLKVNGPIRVKIAGRVLELSLNRNSANLVLADGSGSIAVRLPSGHGAGNIQLGDIVTVRGRMDISGETPLVRGEVAEIVTKCSIELPARLDWETNQYPSAMQREVDLLLGTSIGRRLRLRPDVLRSTRRFLEDLGFQEVDTPHLVPWPEIAPVRPIRINAGRHVRQGDLRITNTEFMRRLLVGGFEKIYQLGRCFRDEDPTFKHAMEFTQLTFGIAYAQYDTLMDLVEALAKHLVVSLDTNGIVQASGREADLLGTWDRITVRDALLDAAGIDLDQVHTLGELRSRIVERGLQIKGEGEYGGTLAHARVLDELIDVYVIPRLVRPTFLTEYPFVLGGPAKELSSRPSYKMRSELFVCGIEIANVSTPQNDPRAVRRWYEDMLTLKSSAGWSDVYLDEPYLTAMDIGIPVSATGGLGFDRLFMLLVGLDEIGHTQFFPCGTWN